MAGEPWSFRAPQRCTHCFSCSFPHLLPASLHTCVWMDAGLADRRALKSCEESTGQTTWTCRGLLAFCSTCRCLPAPLLVLSYAVTCPVFLLCWGRDCQERARTGMEWSITHMHECRVPLTVRLCYPARSCLYTTWPEVVCCEHEEGRWGRAHWLLCTTTHVCLY